MGQHTGANPRGQHRGPTYQRPFWSGPPNILSDFVIFTFLLLLAKVLKNPGASFTPLLIVIDGLLEDPIISSK